MKRYAASGPLADYEVGQRVLTKEGLPGTITDIHEGPADLTTLWVTLDNNMGGGEYAEAEVQPLNQQQAQLASVEHTARDDYPELGDILSERLPPQITTTAAASSDVEEASAIAAHLALYLPPKAPAEQPQGPSAEFDPSEQAGYDDGLAHGKEGITRNPAQPLDPAYMAGYDLGWAQGVAVNREPANSWNDDDLAADQTTGFTSEPIPTSTTVYSMADRLAEMERRGAPTLPTVEAGALWDLIKGTPDASKAFTDVGRRFSLDWCRFRRDSHCWLPKDLNEEASKQAGYAVWNPVDRGFCPRIDWPAQQKCPTGEPGPNAGTGGFTDATIPWDQGGQRGGVPSNVVRRSSLDDHHEFVPDPAAPHMCAVCGEWRYAHPGEKPIQMAAAFEVTATWADVRKKAKRIRSEGGVRVLAVQHGDEIVAHVKGDHGVYETWLRRNPGQHNVAYWHCGCKWGAYSWGRSAPYKRFEGRMCSHALALQYEAQSRSMFGRDLTLDEKQPAWMDQKHVHRPGDYRRDLKRYTSLEVTAHEVDDSYDPEHDGEDIAPVVQMTVSMLSAGSKYKDIRPVLLAMGVERPVEIIKAARTTTFRGKVRGIFRDLLIDDDGHVHDQQTGEHIDHHEVLYPGWDPHFGMDPNDTKVAAKKPDAPKVSGVAVKAADTGRVLMLQRSMDDDKASGKWEWPGGHHEDGDLTSLHAAIREWQEEVGQPFPENGYVAHTWTSPNGIYQGHLVVIPEEKALVLHEGRVMENPDDPNSEACEQVAWWDPDDARRNPALREEVKATTPWAQIKAAALTKAAKEAPKDPEFEKKHPRDNEGQFAAAAKAMLTMAKRNEPKTTAFLQANAQRTGGKMEGLDFKFKSEKSLLRKMKSEAHEFGDDPGKTAANMSDTLRYTTVFDPEKYTEGVNSTLESMKRAGYRMRVKNYWGRGDPYNGINVAAITPTGHPFELQFHTPDSLNVKEKTIHPMYEEWRDDKTPQSRRALLSAEMRDAIDMVHRPAGALGISNRKSQPMPGNIPGYHLRMSSLPSAGDGWSYLLLHTHGGAEPVTVLRSNGGTVEVWRDGDWVTHLDYGRFYFKGEPRTEPISPEEAAQFIEQHGGHIAKSKDTNVPPSEHGDPRLQDAGVSVKRTPSGKYYVTTHRARGKYRDSVADIPDSEIEFIRSTGSSKTAADDPQWLINGKPYRDGVWIEVEPDVWYRGTSHPDIPARFVVRREGDKWQWEAQVLTYINAPHEKKNPKGQASTLEQAQAKALASVAKDHEFFHRYDERQRANLGETFSVLKTADEDQCPACSGDSMPTGGGGYHCMDCGHNWHEDDAAARVFHGSGPMAGIPLGQFVDIPDLMMKGSKEAIMDTPDEFGSLFDEMPVDPRQAAVIQNPAVPTLPGVVAHGDEWGLDVSSGFTVAELHDEPEPALPTTDGAEDDEEEDPAVIAQRLTAALGHPARSRGPATPQESAEERGRRLLAYVDASLAGQEIDGPNPFEHLLAGQADNEIAAAAANHLATKTALKTYSPVERQAIIAEGENDEPAANLDRLDITGTHYEALERTRAATSSKSEDEDLWMLDGDPNGME